MMVEEMAECHSRNAENGINRFAFAMGQAERARHHAEAE